MESLNKVLDKLGGHRSGGEWRADFCPICGKKNNCFSIVLDGQKQGAYYCHANGKGGHINQLEGFKDINFQEFKNQTYKPREQKDFLEIYNRSGLVVDSNKWTKALNERGITKKSWVKVCRRVGDKLLIPVVNDSKKIIGIKYRTLDKKITSEPGSTFDYFINWRNSSDYDKPVYIIEGEIDLMSALECDLNNSVSLSGGVSNLKALITQKEWLRQFKGVVLAFDNDKAGKDAIERAKELLRGFKLFTIDLGEYKDLNEVLMEKGKEEVQKIMEAIQEVKQEPRKHNKQMFEKKAEAIDYFIENIIPEYTDDFMDIWGSLRHWTGKYWTFLTDDTLFKFIDENYNGQFILREKDYRELIFHITKEVSKKKAIREPANKFKFTFNNGTLSFNNGDLRFEKDIFYKEDYQVFIFECDFIYEENPLKIMGHSSLFEKWIDTKIDTSQEREGLRMALSSLFLPFYDTGIFTFLKGNQDGGKSTFIETLQSLLGNESLSTLPMDNSDKFSKVAIYKSIINLTAETSEGIIDPNNFKKLVTRDIDSYRVAFSPTPISARPMAKHLSIGNNLPNVMIKDGVERRLFLVMLNDEKVPFDGNFKEEVKKDKLGVIKVIIQGLFLMEDLKLLDDPGKFNRILGNYCNELLKNEIIQLTNPDAGEFDSYIIFSSEGILDFDEFYKAIRGVTGVEHIMTTKEKQDMKKDKQLVRDRLERYISAKGFLIKLCDLKPIVSPEGNGIFRYYHSRKHNYHYFGIKKG